MQLNVDGKLYLLVDKQELLKIFVAQKKEESAEEFVRAKRKKELDLLVNTDPTDLFYEFETWCWNLIWEAVDKGEGIDWDAASEEIDRHLDELIEGGKPCS
ncbi:MULTISPECIES: hypothetical protein [unclassified Microcoleus]|uniref:hypothetical protein n=1 Tax=unclassified Microcoleus TaxID=2642155 RepID=UPI002FD20602